jgi:hypothetical protein
LPACCLHTSCHSCSTSTTRPFALALRPRRWTVRSTALYSAGSGTCKPPNDNTGTRPTGRMRPRGTASAATGVVPAVREAPLLPGSRHHTWRSLQRPPPCIRKQVQLLESMRRLSGRHLSRGRTQAKTPAGDAARAATQPLCSTLQHPRWLRWQKIGARRGHQSP